MPTNPDPNLMRIFDFTADDLEANRVGQMTNRQIERLSNRHKRGQWLAGMGCVGMIIFIIFIGINSAVLVEENRNWFVLIFIVGSLAVTFVYLGVMDRKADLKTGKIQTLVGLLSVYETKDKWGSISYYLRPWPIDSQISKSLYLDIQNYLVTHNANTKFRLYYASESLQLLSIEAVDQ